MDIYIGNRFLGAVEAAGLFETSTRFFVDDPLLFGLDEALLTSYLRGSSQGTAYLSDYRVSSPLAPVPLPASAFLLAFGIGGLAVFRRFLRSAARGNRSSVQSAQRA